MQDSDDLWQARQSLDLSGLTPMELTAAEMVAADKEEARKEALQRLRGFKVVGSMENPRPVDEPMALCMLSACS